MHRHSTRRLARSCKSVLLHDLHLLICKRGWRLALPPRGADAGHVRVKAPPAHTARARLTALRQPLRAVCTGAGPAHRITQAEMPSQAQEARPQADASCRPGTPPPSGAGSPHCKGRGHGGLESLGDLLPAPSVSARVPATPGFTVDGQAEGPQEGGLGRGQGRCLETRQEPLPGAGVGIPCRSREDTDKGTKNRAGALGGNQGRQGDGARPGGGGMGGGLRPLWPASVSQPRTQAGMVWEGWGASSPSEAVCLPVLCEHEKGRATSRDSAGTQRKGLRAHSTRGAGQRRKTQKQRARKWDPSAGGRGTGPCVPTDASGAHGRWGHPGPAALPGVDKLTTSWPVPPAPGWGDPVPPCSGWPDPAPGAPPEGLPPCSGAGIPHGRREASSCPPPPTPALRSPENAPLCGSQAHCVARASRCGPRGAHHAEPGTAAAPRLDTRVFTLAHVCVPGHQGKARRDPGPPTTLAGDRVQPAPAHLPSHSCWDGNCQVTGWLKGSAAQPGPPRAEPHRLCEEASQGSSCTSLHQGPGSSRGLPAGALPQGPGTRGAATRTF